MKHASENQHRENQNGIFYVVATPIGNLADISQRALSVLAQADIILAEDTRHSKSLLKHYGIKTPLKACHEHNEQSLTGWVKSSLLRGMSLALISDAGTPLISDPGFVIVRELREAELRIEVIPGPSAVIAALSVAGLATDRFVFDGFLPVKQSAREKQLAEYVQERRTIVLLESSHRIEACLVDLLAVMGDKRNVVIAREMTKKFETVISGSARSILQILEADPNQTKGEFVLMIAGASDETRAQALIELERILRVLLEELPVKQAAKLAVDLCGVRKNDAYQLALEIRENDA